MSEERTVAEVQVDTNTKIPASVTAQAARAEEIHKRVYEASQEMPSTEGKSAGSPELIVGGEGAAPTEGQQAQGQEPTAPAPAPVSTPTPAPASAPESAGENWQHRYESMKGRYDAEVPRLRAQIRELGQRLTEVATAQRAAEAYAQAPAQTQQGRKLITDQEEKDYGSEFLTVVGKKAREEFLPEVDALRQQVSDLTNRLTSVGTHVAQSAREAMWSYLDTNFPRWRELNEAPKFLDWLGLPDVFSGATRMELLQRAVERNDGPRVLAFFSGFLREEAAVSPPVMEPQPAQAPVPPQISLGSLAAPGRVTSAASAPAPAKPIITRAQLAQYNSDVARGAYRGRESEKARRDAEIASALSEGRIR